MSITFFAIPSPLVAWHLAVLLVICFLGGFLIGLFNVAGGVLFAPTLMMLPGVSPVSAVGTVFVSAVPMSAARMLQLHRYGMIRWKLAAPLAVGAASAAFAGQFLLPHFNVNVIKMLVGTVAFLAGLKELVLAWKRRQQSPAAKIVAQTAEANSVVGKPEPAAEGEAQEQPSVVVPAAPAPQAADLEAAPTAEKAAAPRAALAEPAMTPAFALRSFVIGALGGFLSSIGGLGGPIVLMPLYLSFMPPVDMKVLIGIINPTASSLIVSSVVGALAWGSPDVGLAMVMTPVMVTGSLLGGYLQQRIPSEKLKPLVCAVLLVFGAFIIAQVLIKVL